MMNKKIMLGLIILALIISGCSPTGKVVQEDKIKIGVLSVLSGEATNIGEAIKKGLNLAAEDINNNGGVLGKKLELVYEDTHLDAKQAVTVMNKFTNIDKLPIVISGEGSGATLAAAPLADRTKTIMIVAIASNPDIKKAGDYVFRVIPSDDYQGTEIARIASDSRCSQAAVMYVNDAYGFGIKAVFTNNFAGEVLAEEAFDSGTSDVRTQLAKIKAASPNCMILIARNEFPQILTQAKELGLSAMIITSVEFKDESLLKASGNAAEGVLVPFYEEHKDDIDFKSKFKKKYGSEPAPFSDYGYDAMKAIAEAIKKAGSTDSEKVKNALYEINFRGATGEIKFDSNGDVIGKSFVVYQVKNGAFVSLE